MHLPAPLRAAVGLVASAADEARHLPDRAIELPMLAVSTALQLSLRAQQRYAMLAARGDEVLNRGRATDAAPPWATFDDPVAPDAPGEPASDTTVTPIGKAAEPTARDATTQAPAKKTAAANQVAANRPAKRTSAAATGTSRAKSVSKPRHTAPSKFDDADD